MNKERLINKIDILAERLVNAKKNGNDEKVKSITEKIIEFKEQLGQKPIVKEVVIKEKKEDSLYSKATKGNENVYMFSEDDAEYSKDDSEEEFQ